MTSVCFFTAGGPGAPPIRADLEAVGLKVKAELTLGTLVQDVVRSAPEVVVCYDNHPGAALFAVTAALQETAPCPVVLFTTDPDVEAIERAAAAGIQAYVVDGYAPRRLRSVVQVAQARFRRDQALREDLAALRDRFSERKLVDRAKGILMRVRDVPEDEAFSLLRSAAMQSQQRMGQVAQQVIDATRYAEAINRAGQLRMLSQRVVTLTGLRCTAAPPKGTSALLRGSIEQVETNLAVLSRILSRATFGDLVDGVLEPWAALKRAVTGDPAVARLGDIDVLAESLLVQAEALTRNLETAGFAAALRVINVSGRQRMLSQRIAKGAILSALLPPTPARAAEMRKAEREFDEGMVFLSAAPLSTTEIRDAMAGATETWEAFRRGLARPAGEAAEIAESSEALLARFDDLTALYEQGIQRLMA